MIRHLLKLIRNQRKSNIWIGLELLIVYVCVWYIVDYCWAAGNVWFAPTGWDTGHTYRCELRLSGDDLSDEGGGEENLFAVQNEEFFRIVDQIRKYGPVESVALMNHCSPYSAFINKFPVNQGRDTVESVRWEVTTDFFRVFDCLDREAAQRIDSLRPGCKIAVINQTMADRLFPGVDASGKYVSEHYINYEMRQINGNWQSEKREVDERMYIAGVVPALRANEFERDRPAYFKLMTGRDLNMNLYFLAICLRVRPEEDHGFAERFRRELAPHLTARTYKFLEIRPMSEYRRLTVKPQVNALRTRTVLLFFLFTNLFLGVIGTFWVRTRRRRHELGIRMALGSTKGQLRRLMVGEGLVLLSLAMIPAIIICLNMVFTELPDTTYMDLTPGRVVAGFLITTLLSALMVTAGILYPASVSANIQPAEVLHEE